MSIPISADEMLPWVDPDTKVTYYFGYLTGDKLVEFSKLQKLTLDFSAYITDAAKYVEKSNPGRKWKKGEKDQVVRDKAIEMASEKGSQTSMVEYACALVDLFLKKWEGENLPPFPPKPSRCLKQDLLFKLSSKISESVGDLIGLTEEDAKN